MAKPLNKISFSPLNDGYKESFTITVLNMVAHDDK